MSTVRLERDGAVAHVVLDRPAQLNAISPELLRDLDAACAAIEDDAGVRAVTLTGAGRAFCAGADLRVVEELAPDPAARLGDQHANFALVAGGGGSQRLPRLIGARRAKELMLLGGWIDARQALDWGLVTRVAPSGTVEAATRTLAAVLAA